MKNKRFDIDDEDNEQNIRRNTAPLENKKRRPPKNWTRFYQEHESDYDELDEFHS